MLPQNIEPIISEAMAIEAEEAKEAGALGFMARAMVQATMPHSKTTEHVFERTNGNYSLVMMAPPKIGLPYGSIPRLLMAWITTEAVRIKSPELVLGNTLSSFMSKLGLVPTGGRWGSITRLRHQSHRLFASSVSCSYEAENEVGEQGYRIAKNHHLWWDPKNVNQTSIFQSTVTLSRDFFDEIIERPVPIDMRALKALKQSPMALDIYCWTTYRMFYLKKPTTIPWPLLQMQFGSGYPIDQQGQRDFKKAFLRHLKKVELVYPDLRLDPSEKGIELAPSKTHVKGILKG